MGQRLAAAILLGVALSFAEGCGGERAAPQGAASTWPEVLKRARGQEVAFAMWPGDPYINAYVKDFVAPRLSERYGVKLRTIGAQGNQIVSLLMTEMEAGRADSGADLVWINGETFYQLRQIHALHGPFTLRLPNARYIDWDNRFIAFDFQQPVGGFECPWGNVQLALITDTRRVSDPPRTRAALAAWVKAHPGRFTLDVSFTGLTLLKSWLIDIAGGERELAGPFDEAKYARHAGALWEYVNGIKAWFWKQGRTFPADVAQMHQLFASGEIDFTMSNNDGEVDNKVAQGLLPETSRAFVLDSGTIQNSHYLGIVNRSRHLDGALAVIDFMISPEAQLEKQKSAVWGDGTILAIPRLPEEWQEAFRTAGARRHGPSRAEIQPKALMELAPEYMLRLFEDFRKFVIGAP